MCSSDLKRIARKPVHQNPFDDPAYRRRADAEDEAWAKRVRVYIQTQMLHTAEELARDIGLEGIAERRLGLARDDQEYQRFLDQVLGGRRASLPR